MKNILSFAFLFSLIAAPASHAAVNPSSLIVKLYALWVSPNGDCSSPINLFDGGSTPRNFDMIQAPTIGGGNPPDGTYNCLILKMSSVLTVIPAASEGSCTAGSSYSFSVCRSGSSTTPINGTTYGADVNCVGSNTDATPTDNTVYLYISTSSTGTGNNAFNRTTSTSLSNGITLASPFIVSGSTAGTFVVNGAGKVDGSGATCNMNPPTFSFH